MRPPNPTDQGLWRVHNIRHVLSYHSLPAPSLLPLLTRYEELDAEITRFEQM